MSKTIGIIGGMGPLATVDLFGKIVANTTAANDREHIPVVIDNNTRIPDRTAGILHNGESPIREMVRSAVKLESMGADFLIMPCNTAHFFYNDIVKFVNIPMINMLEETAKAIKEMGIGKVGLLATNGTIESGVYATAFEKFNVEFVTPNEEHQKAVMDLIYNGVKAGNFSIDITAFRNTINYLVSEGVEYVVLGCTELPIAFEKWEFNVKSIDPTLVLAKSAIKYASEEVLV